MFPRPADKNTVSFLPPPPTSRSYSHPAVCCCESTNVHQWSSRETKAIGYLLRGRQRVYIIGCRWFEKSTADWVLYKWESLSAKHTRTIRDTDRRREGDTPTHSYNHHSSASPHWRCYTHTAPLARLSSRLTATEPLPVTTTTDWLHHPAGLFTLFYKSRDERLKRMMLEWCCVVMQPGNTGFTRSGLLCRILVSEIPKIWGIWELKEAQYNSCLLVL